MRPILRTQGPLAPLSLSDDVAGVRGDGKGATPRRSASPAPVLGPPVDYSAMKVVVATPSAPDRAGAPPALTSPRPGCVTTDPRELPIGHAALPGPAAPSAFRQAFADVFVRCALAAHPGAFPDPRALALRLAQAGLESAQGTHLYCFNFGGAKAGQAGHFFYASTFEGMPPAKADALVAEHPDLYSMDRQNNRFGRDGAPIPNKDGNVMVRFARAAKGASFAAFPDANAGVTAFLAGTEKRARAALGAVDHAEPPGSVNVVNAYRDALWASHYFTGDREGYGRQLKASYDACLQAITGALRRAMTRTGAPLAGEQELRLVLQRDTGELPPS